MGREETLPFLAATPGALKGLVVDPNFEKLLKEGIFKDIWGSEWSGFMGIQDPGDSSEIEDNPQGRVAAFGVDVSIYRCVDIRGAAIASTPLKVWDGWDWDTRQEVQHEALDVLLRTNPFPQYVTGPQLLRYSLGSRDLQGSFAWRLVYDTGGRLRNPLPREIYWLPPAQYKPVTGADVQNDPTVPASLKGPKIPFAGLKVRPGNQKPEKFLPSWEVVYAPTYNPQDPLKGTSKISALKDDLNLRLYGAKSNLWFFRNNQRPDVVVTGAFSPTTENVNLMRRIWRAAFGGDQARGPAFLPADMKVQLLTMAAKDAEWLGQRHAAREDILAAFGVPPPVYGDLSRATYENIRTAYESFWRSAMIPEMQEIGKFLTLQYLYKWPDAQRNGLVLDFDYTQVVALKEDANAVWERGAAFIKTLLDAVERNCLTPNQWRPLAQSVVRMIGLPDKSLAGTVPGGDMFYVRGNTIPIIEASVQASVDIMAARAAVTGGETNKPGNGSWTLPDASQRAAIPPRGGATPPAAGPPASPKSLPPAQQRALPTAPKEREATLSRSVDPADWLTRRLKRHFQDQQTAALRALRAGEQPGPRQQLWDGQAGQQGASELLKAALEMAGSQPDADEVERWAAHVEAETLAEVRAALAQDGEGAVNRVRLAFRRAIEERAQEIAQQVVEAATLVAA